MPERYDVLVLGGGAAGCAVAARLAERDASVGLVEAGPDYGPYAEGRWPAEMLEARTLPMTHLWEQAAEDRSSSRARIIGGCSAHNAAMIVRGEPRDYDEWGHGWTYETIAPYLDRAEEQLGVREEITAHPAPWHRAALEAAATLGIAGGALRANVRGDVRWNAAFAYLDPVRDRVEIHADTLVDRLDPPHVRTDRGVLEAETIVLAAGAYGTPPILLRSGLGNELPVGEGLTDHVGIGMGWAPTDELLRDTAAHEAEHGPLHEAYSLLAPPDLHLGPWTNRTEDGGYDVSMIVFFLKPRSNGRVALASDDPREPPLVDHGFLADERDLEPVLEGVELARRLARAEPLARYAKEELRPGTDDVAGYVRENVRGYFHPVGTCALGAVCDGRGRVLGHESLVVADASFIPSIPRANTHLTALAVAERIAETL
ncbi:MAG TPA: GMC family oxidoreductase [Gaiellaceae bacterium]